MLAGSAALSAASGNSFGVDLWICPEGSVSAPLVDASVAWLSDDEAARWKRFIREEDRRRFLLARGLVRSVLARCTGQTPSSLAFEVGPYGKPALVGEPDSAATHFNLSHTRGLVVLAVCREAEVGVDVEAIDRNLDPLRLAARNFSISERATLEACADENRATRFFEVWTLKEAYVKALGVGLTHELGAFSVMLDPQPPSIIEHVDGADRIAPCRCWLVEPMPGYRLGLVVRGDPRAAIDVRISGPYPR